jgi:hypothetical protein
MVILHQCLAVARTIEARKRSHIGGICGMSPGTDAGAMTTIRIPSPTITSATGTSMAALAGQELLGNDKDGDHGHPGDADDVQRHQHQHQSDARANAVKPERESGADVLAASPAEELLERGESPEGADAPARTPLTDSAAPIDTPPRERCRASPD